MLKQWISRTWAENISVTFIFGCRPSPEFYIITFLDECKGRKNRVYAQTRLNMGVSASIYEQRRESVGLCMCTPSRKRLPGLNPQLYASNLIRSAVGKTCGWREWQRWHRKDNKSFSSWEKQKLFTKNTFGGCTVFWSTWCYCGCQKSLRLVSDGFPTVWLLTAGAKWWL